MTKAIRADEEHRLSPKGREIIDFRERLGYVPSGSNRNKSSPEYKPSVDYRNLEQALQDMNINIDNT